jgi:hypothetical protein
LLGQLATVLFQSIERNSVLDVFRDVRLEKDHVLERSL